LSAVKFDSTDEDQTA